MRAWWFIDQLVQQGITHFCIAPGSRSTPLVEAAVRHPKATTFVHFDERGLGFYALGFGKGAKHPAAVIVTSGTALGNLFPSVMEAHHSETPLLLLTADRPLEWKDCGANQATDQLKFFGSFTRWQTDLTTDADEKTVRSIALQSIFHATGVFPGPVQINIPFREPLFSFNTPSLEGGPMEQIRPKLTTPPLSSEAKRGIILLGKVDDPKEVLQLAERLGWPVFADILSNARKTPTKEQITHFDFLIKTKTPKPDLLIHFGERLTSKQILDWEKDVPYFHVSPSPLLQDPARRISKRIQSDIACFSQEFQADTDPDWLALWQKMDQDLESQINDALNSPFTEAHLYRQLPLDRPLFLGNGMPIRDANRFFPKQGSSFFGNRGLSGIDGNIATLRGIFDALKTPIIGVIGDQTALHDLNSIALLKDRPILLILLNNFGGGIFEHLPVSQSPCFETHFAATHQWNFQKVAEMFDIPYLTTTKPLASWPLSGIVELITDRKKNYAFQKDLKICSTALL